MPRGVGGEDEVVRRLHRDARCRHEIAQVHGGKREQLCPCGCLHVENPIAIAGIIAKVRDLSYNPWMAVRYTHVDGVACLIDR